MPLSARGSNPSVQSRSMPRYPRLLLLFALLHTLAHAHRRATLLHSSSHREGTSNRFVPTYAPVLTLAHVTEPTAYPPPPPILEPWSDSQLVDTWVGHHLIKPFIAPPTVTPPPTQNALDAALGCPLFTSPDTFKVQSTYLGSTGGVWQELTTTKGLLVWNETAAIAPMTNSLGSTDFQLFIPHSGDLLGRVKERFEPFGTYLDVLDCALNLKFVVQEKSYLSAKTVDPELCRAHGGVACRGRVYNQLVVYDSTGAKVVAQVKVGSSAAAEVGQHTCSVRVLTITRVLRDKEKRYTVSILDSSGNSLASATREGKWLASDTPTSTDTQEPRFWTLKVDSSASSPLAVPEGRWVLGAIVTAWALRERDRQLTGWVSSSPGQRASLVACCLVFLGMIAVLAAYFFIKVKYRYQIAKYLLRWEEGLLPQAPYKPDVSV